MMTEQEKIAIILDANVFIKQIAFRDLLPEAIECYEFFTLRAIIDEIRDEAARDFV